MSQNTISGMEESALVPPTSDEKTMAVLAHILTIVTWFIAPLVIYLIKKDESSFVAAHAKESLNFQITLFIAYLLCMALMLALIGFVLIWIVPIVALILVIMATIKASEGKPYRYPVALRLIK